MLEILYIMPGNVAAGPLGAGEITQRKEVLERWAGSNAAVEVWDSPQGPLSIESSYDEALCVPPLLELVMRARKDKFDAVIVGCFGDTGLEAARELVSIPVIGPAQASMHFAAMLGSKFSILTVLESVVGMIERLVKAHDMSGRLGSIRVIDTPVLGIAGDKEGIYRRLSSEAVRAVEEDKADALILGCMSLAFQEALLARLQSELKIPVINPAQAALCAAESFCRMKVAHSALAYPRPPEKTQVPVGRKAAG